LSVKKNLSKETIKNIAHPNVGLRHGLKYIQEFRMKKMDSRPNQKGIGVSPNTSRIFLDLLCIKELFRANGTEKRCLCPWCNAIKYGRPAKPENTVEFPELLPINQERRIDE